MNPVTPVLLTILLAVVVWGSRRHALMGMICGVLYLAQGQSIDLFGMNLFPTRFLEVAAFLRVLARREFSFAELNRVDRALLWLYAYTTVIYLIRSKEGHAAMIATSCDALLCYFAFRGLVRNMGDLRWFLSTLVVVLVPFMILLAIERKTGRIPLRFMAGSAGVEGAFVRDGSPRCFGSFRNMDLLGTFGATFLPLYVALIMAKIDRPRAMIGAGFCLAIVFFANAGGPVSATGVAFVGWALWAIRHDMRLFRWGLVMALGMLAVVMKAPIWYLIDRVSQVTGGSGWHRSYLIDVCIRHLDSWWLVGMPIADTADWFFYVISHTGGADITNEYIHFGISAGLGAVALLIWLLVRAFSQLGKAMAIVRSAGSKYRPNELMLWGLGVMLTVHVINWLGISYFDQIHVVWMMQLAAIATLSSLVLQDRQPGVTGSTERSGPPPPSGAVPSPNTDARERAVAAVQH